MIENTELLDKIITGYVPHKIYAFSTPQLLNYLKVGETSRSVNVRLSEWRKLISDLKLEKDWLAMLPKDSDEQTDFFQDHALHKFFENQGFKPRKPDIAPGHSKEFYPVTVQDIEDGIDAIAKDYLSEPPREYTYLSIKDNSKVEEHWKRNQDFSPRDNQQAVIDNIVAVSKDEDVPRNYLLFAVMRFGKTFVALEAAKALDAKFTVVVSAKADVKSEWKKNLESHIDFEDYKFLDSDDMKNSSTAIQDTLDSGKRVVLFLTLQDLKGKSIKEKHKQLFNKKVDLLIVDESHFGARAQSYGQVIHKWVGTGKKRKLVTFDAYEEQVTDDKEDNDEVNGLNNVKAIDASFTLHLSGTPYRILMGSEFDNPKQIVGKVRFEDILEEKSKWYKEHLEEPEWENPYFGFPQMVRFAFYLNDAATSKIDTLASEGKKSQLNELFGPASNEKTDEEHLKFKHEGNVLETLKALDGAEDSKSIFSILNYDKIKNGKMAHHIVMVLPYKASCDAMEEILNIHKDEFNNLGDYEIINIAGFDSNFNNLGKPATEKIKAKIEELSKEGKKTISLTVNKMLTGVTVAQWDTMIFLKDTQSPQEYDQAIYRLQSPYVTNQYDIDGNMVSKEDLKPQTLLIDFAPNRMMNIEQYKAFIFSASEGGAGNDKVGKTLKRQMDISPIITINSEKLTQVRPADILKYVAAYSSEKGIIEEASEISVDLSILNNSFLREVIENENEIGSKSGLKFIQNEDGKDLSRENNVNSEDGSDDLEGNPDSPDGSSDSDKSGGKVASEEEKLEKKVQNFYLRILFYAFLSEETEINSLSDVINSYDNNQRLAHHLGIEKNVLKTLSQVLTNSYVRSDLDNKISNANALLADDTVQASDKVDRAIKSFKRISESEVFTPRHITELMTDDLFAEMDLSDFNKHPKKFIDLASKSGIYLLVLFEKLLESDVNIDIARKSLYAVTTSPIAYEFTRKVFELMDFPTENILDIDCASSYDLINEINRPYSADGLKQYYFKGEKNMKFDVVIGNPPYQEKNVGNNNQATPIYNYFYDLAKKIGTEYSLISPARFLSNQGATPKTWNKKMLNDEHLEIQYFNSKSMDVFPGVDIKGGVVILHRNRNKNYGAIDTFIPFDKLRSIFYKVKSFSEDTLSSMVYSPDSYRFTDVLFEDHPELKNRTDASHLKAVASNVFTRYPEIFFDEKPQDGKEYIQIYGRLSGERTYKYVKRIYVAEHSNLDKWKVILPGANGTGAFGETLSTPIIGEPGVGHNQTFVSIGAFDTRFEANALLKYIKSKFGRAMLDIMKITQNNQSKSSWSKVPLQNFTETSKDIDWEKNISTIDEQLYEKYSLSEVEKEFIENNVKTME